MLQEKANQNITKLNNKRGTLIAVRDYLLFLTALYTGLKTKELTQLKIKDLNFEKKYLILSSSKNPRKIPLSNTFRKELMSYMKRITFISPDDFLFKSLKGQHMTQRAIQLRFKYYSSILGLKMPISALRNTFAIVLFKASQDPYWVAELLGLKTLKHVMVYCSYFRTEPKEKWNIIDTAFS